MKKIFETELSGRKLVVEVGQLAQYANGSCLVRYGDTVVLSTATAADPKPDVDFFPLSVDYQEKMYAVGKIPGGFLRREGRPTEHAILTARQIDRPMRPLFPDDMRNEVSINNLVLSVDQDNMPETASLLGSSIAVSISDIPWHGPIAGVNVGLVDGEIIVNPTEEERAASDLNLTVAGSKEKVCMIEAGANEVPDDVMMEAIKAGHQVIQDLCDFIAKIQAEVGKEKFSYPSSAIPEDIYEFLFGQLSEHVSLYFIEGDKDLRDHNIQALEKEFKQALEDLPESSPFTAEELLPYVEPAMQEIQKYHLRREIVEKHHRIDDRALDEIRPLHAEVDLLPRVHGSALFQRGETQVLTATTLASLDSAQKLDGLDALTEKRYMHQYNFPGYSVGDPRGSRSPGRREIGHGALAERALEPVIPSAEEFPYAIRNVSEVLMSNGSTSQASICASSLALMAAGVPIKAPVAGISCGLITDEKLKNGHLLMMDIQGVEDFYGDMDFKVGGTEKGITAIQVDIKVEGLSLEIIQEALALTRKGRLEILRHVMAPVLAAPRTSLSDHAPKISTLDIPENKIREVIGSGGKVIKRLVAETGCQIEVVEDGAVGHIYFVSPDADIIDTAINQVKMIVFNPEPGTHVHGTITNILDFGAFLEYAPGKEGLIHISKIAPEHVDKVEDYLQVGQEADAYVLEIDHLGRVNLTMMDPSGDADAADSGNRRGGRSRRPSANTPSRRPRPDARSDQRRSGGDGPFDGPQDEHFGDDFDAPYDDAYSNPMLSADEPAFLDDTFPYDRSDFVEDAPVFDENRRSGGRNRGGQSGRSYRNDRGDRNDRTDRNDRDRNDRDDHRGNRSDRGDRTDRNRRSDRRPAGDRTDRNAKANRNPRQRRSNRDPRQDQTMPYGGAPYDGYFPGSGPWDDDIFSSGDYNTQDF